MTAATKSLKPLSLRRNFSWTFFGNAVYAACQWGILVLLAKIGNPAMVGQFTLGLAVVAPIILLSELQLRAIQATDANQQYQLADYLGLRLITTMAALGIILVVVISGKFPPQTALVILLMGLAKGFEAFSDVLYGFLQHHERMDWVARSLLWKGPCSLIAVGISLIWSQNVVFAALSLAIVWGILLLLHDIPSSITLLQENLSSQNSPQHLPIIRLPISWQVQPLLSLVRLSLPLGLVMMLISLNANIPRYFIEWHLGDRTLGIFAALSYLMVVTGMIVEALGESISPRLAKYYAMGDRQDFQKLLLQVIGICLLLGLLGIAVAATFGKELLSLIYRPEYAEHNHLFVGLMVVAAMHNVTSILGFAMTAAHIFKVQTVLFAVATFASSICCWIFIPTWGLQGAVLALLVAVMVQFLISIGVVIHAIQRLPAHATPK